MTEKGFYIVRGHLKESKPKDAAGPWGRDKNQSLDLEDPESHLLPPASGLSFSLKTGFAGILGHMAGNGLSQQLPGLPLLHLREKQNEPGLFQAQF